MAVYRHYANEEAPVDALVMDAYLDFALREPRRREAAFLIRAANARRFPDDFDAGRSPAGARQLAMLERLRPRGELRDVQPIEAPIAYPAMAPGLVTLHRAGRVAGDDAAFRRPYRRTLERCLASLRVKERR